MNGFGKPLGRFWGLLEVKRDGPIGPGIVELMAAIAANDYTRAQSPRRFRKTSRLVPQLAR